MKLRLQLVTIFMVTFSWAQSIFENSITGTNPSTSNPYIIGQSLDANITVSGISRGSGINPASANNRYSANNWNVSSFDNSKYFEFTLTPNTGYQINFSTFEYTGQASSTGASNFAFRSSIDGYTSNIGTPTNSGVTIDLLTGIYQNITTPITFRFYGWGASSSGGTFSINDFVFNGSVVSSCTPPTIAIAPSSGPEGTEVTITSSSGSLSGSSVFFGAISATIVSNTGTVMVVEVPSGATSGNITITDSQPCVATVGFTVLKEVGMCSGLSELIMTEVYDNNGGSLGYIEVYNGTGSTIDLTNYFIRRYGDNTEFIANNFTDFFFSPSITTIPDGGVIYGRISNDANIASPNFDFSNSSGINGDDILHLYNGTTLIDVYIVPSNTVGYTALRNVNTVGPNSVSNPSDWTHTNTETTANLGIFNYLGASNLPTVDTNPIDVFSCETTASFTVSATAASLGTLTYQWYYNDGIATGWTSVNSSSFSGVTTTGYSSTILNLVGSLALLDGYQFYCEVVQDGTCSVISDAAQLKVIETTWDGFAWSNGLPDISKLAMINGNYDTAINGNFECCSLVVNSTFTLNIQASTFVLIQNDLTVKGVLNVLDDGSLIQVDDLGVNMGAISYERITSGNALDYVYWSSPVENYTTPSSGYVFSWSPTMVNSNGGIGNWTYSLGVTMQSGVGYIMRDVFSKTFDNGVARNGVISTPIQRGSYTGPDYAGVNGMVITNLDDNLNLLGNPYPSSINAIDFLTANTNIEGAVRIWTHGISPSSAIQNPFYGSFQSNYSINDYLIYNSTGSSKGPGTFNGFIAGGQGFFTIMNDGVASSQSVVFNNSMRDKAYDNGQFYRGISSNGFTDDKHRIWLNLNNAINQSAKTLVGYVNGATIDYDRMYDAVALESTESTIYSLVDNKKMSIQGRYPFSEKDKVPLGVKITKVGVNSIGVFAVDGIFDQQNIYLEDLYLNKIHDLKTTAYSFDSQVGTFNDRFVLRFKDIGLSTDEFVINEDEIQINTDQFIEIKSLSNKNIKSVVVYDVLARKVFDKENISNNSFVISNLNKNNTTLIVKIKLDNNLVVSKKIIF
ncbi:T9SS sorting signal type C domain-containing protein [Flavobacterium jejuense]|uniref:T9SS sorting signal type C domain-containing protein n=1 Tax=Flavobacterium jejuense TaxID=1544455 RepID=A0ABX0IVX8_9FLAO|nr:T9SS sorting signal type C domain-containing protein [Flavobacterium jejuense]NHN27346.1 T9SS sorting signal type C domain-containing protein [Flavobacterium jejuense]